MGSNNNFSVIIRSHAHFLDHTGCPRSEMSKRNWFRAQTEHIWPIDGKAKYVWNQNNLFTFSAVCLPKDHTIVFISNIFWLYQQGQKCIVAVLFQFLWDIFNIGHPVEFKHVEIPKISKGYIFFLFQERSYSEWLQANCKGSHQQKRNKKRRRTRRSLKPRIQ